MKSSGRLRKIRWSECRLARKDEALREGERGDGGSARGETFGQRGAHDRVFRPRRRLDGREGTWLRTHGKGDGPFRFWIAYAVRHAPRRPALQENRRFACSAFVGGLFALLACSVSAQNPLPTPGIPTEAEAERVIITGSNIPTAEETGPNPVDTYRTQDIEKLGARNTTDLLTKLPQEMGSTINQNHNGVGGGDGSVIPNLRGLLPKETLVLIDGKRAAIIGSGGGVAAGASPGVA